MSRKLTEQLAVRLTEDEMQWLREVSDEGGRTVAQTVRWVIRLVRERGLPQ